MEQQNNTIKTMSTTTTAAAAAASPARAKPSSSSSFSSFLSAAQSQHALKAPQTQTNPITNTDNKSRKRPASALTSSSSPSSSTAVPASSSSSVLARVVALGAADAAALERQSRIQLADLDLPNVKLEVATMEENQVRREIERIMFTCVSSIMSGQGFSFSVPSRSASNQLYVPEIDRFVLKDRVSDRVFASIKNGRKAALTTRLLQLVYELCCKRIHVTKRDLFYTDVKLFNKQTESDDIIDDVACMVGCTRSSLNVVASEKGIVVGRLSFKDDGDLIDCTRMGVGGKAIPPYMDRVTDIQGDAKFVLLVEKDAAFMRLAEDRFYNTFPCVIITGKGQPDVATRLFVKKIKETLKIPVLALMDSDPYGLKILSVYMSGSKNMSYDSANLATADIKWLGVRPSDLDKYEIPNQCRLPLSEHDIKFGKEMLEEEFVKKNPKWLAELELMVKRKEKAEIQALSNFGFQYLTQVYLPKKLRDGDWI